MSSESFSETRSQPPSPSIPSTPSTGSPQVLTAPVSSPASSQPTSAPSFHTSAAETSIFDVSAFFSLDPRPVMTRDPSSGIHSPSLPSSEVDSQSIPPSMWSSQASENFTAPRGTWTVSTEEYPRPTDDVEPNSQTSSEEGFIYFNETLPLSPSIPFSQCRGGTPQISPQATSPDTSNPQTRPNLHPTPILQIKIPGSWVSSRSTSPMPSPPLSKSQPSAQPHTETSSNPSLGPILQVEVTIMPGSWVSPPNSPIPSLLSSPVLGAATSSDSILPNPSTTSRISPPPPPTTPVIPVGTDADTTPETTITIAGLNICSSTSSKTDTSSTNTNTCSDLRDSTDKTSSNSSSSNNTTKGPPTYDTASTFLTTLTRSSCESSEGTRNLSAPPSPVSSTGSFEPACVQQWGRKEGRKDGIR